MPRFVVRVSEGDFDEDRANGRRECAVTRTFVCFVCFVCNLAGRQGNAQAADRLRHGHARLTRRSTRIAQLIVSLMHGGRGRDAASFLRGEITDTEPSNPSQTPLPQRINGLSPLPCVLTCVLKPQSHCSYPQANMGCRSRQTSRGTVLRNDRPRRVRAAQRCPDRIHISRLQGGRQRRRSSDTTKNTNTLPSIDRIVRGNAIRNHALPPEEKNSGELEISTFFRLSAMSGRLRLSPSLSPEHIFLGDNFGDMWLLGRVCKVVRRNARCLERPAQRISPAPRRPGREVSV